MSKPIAGVQATIQRDVVSAQFEKNTIGAYMKSREGKRWRRQDTSAVLARAAEIDRVMQKLLVLAGIPVVGQPEAEPDNPILAFPRAAHVS